MMLNTKKLKVALFAVLITSALYAGDKSNVSGQVFADYFMDISRSDTLDNKNAFQFRRIYLTYENSISENFSAQVRLEMQSKEGSSMDPFVKTAFLKWSNLIPNAKVLIGLQSTPTWKTSEKVWGYRSVDKTVIDKNKAGSSVDLGIAIKGSVSADGTVGYHIMVANGEGKKGESNKYKKVMFNLPVKIADNVVVEPYVDYQSGDKNGDKTMLMALFAGYKGKEYRFGAHYLNHKTEMKVADVVKQGFSVFGAAKVSERTTVFGRFDSFDPNTDSSNDEHSYVVAGVDFTLDKKVKIIPNLKHKMYKQSGKDDDTQAVLTLTYKF